MKTSTLKRMNVMLLALLITSLFTASAALTISSMKGSGLPMYPQHNGAAAGTAVTGITFDYKLVTISGKSWAWTNLHGAGAIGGATWSSQLRYYSSTYGKTENNLLNRVTGSTTTQTYGTTTNTIPAAPLKISFFQDPNGMIETDFIPYDITKVNSPVTGDVTAPSMSSCTSSGVTETAATINITGTDDSGDLFYYITGNGISEISFFPSITLAGLTPSTNYNLTVTPIDFSGNMGTSTIVSFTTAGLVQVTYGIAKDIKFRFKSTATQFEYYYEPVDPSKKFRDAFIKITPAGGTEFEIKPTLSPDSSYVYGISTDANIANKILSLNCGYWIAPGLPDYSDYVLSNTTITAGDLNGNPIKHLMGGAIQPSQSETIAPVLTAVSLVDVNSGYAKLNIDGSDNSGAVYYTISGAKATVNAFHTGSYYLTNIDAGKVYTLNVVAKDFSGNSSAAIQQKVKTMNARTNILNGELMKYNTIAKGTGGELASMISVNGNSLTIGCNTTNTGLTGTALNKKFITPTIKINGTTYPLTLSTPDSTSAQFTFNGTIGTTPIATGTSFTIQFSVFWSPPYGGNFFTGIFNYTIGDNGQVDNQGPSTPASHLTGNNLIWNACTDDLSGVKWYTVAEAGQPVAKIFDLGETSFTYNMVNRANTVTVTAVDFVGNSTGTSTILSANRDIQINNSSIYPNPASDRIFISGDVAEIAFYTLQGQLVHSVYNKNIVDVSTFAKGLYLVKATNRIGTVSVNKLEIK